MFHLMCSCRLKKQLENELCIELSGGVTEGILYRHGERNFSCFTLIWQNRFGLQAETVTVIFSTPPGVYKGVIP